MNQKQGFAVFALRPGKVNGMRGSLLPGVIVTAPCSPLRRTGDCTCNPVCSLVEQIVGNSWLLIMYHALKSALKIAGKHGSPAEERVGETANAGKVATKFSVRS